MAQPSWVVASAHGILGLCIRAKRQLYSGGGQMDPCCGLCCIGGGRGGKDAALAVRRGECFGVNSQELVVFGTWLRLWRGACDDRGMDFDGRYPALWRLVVWLVHLAQMGPKEATMTPKFTCLIPAYNEASRIAGVLQSVGGHPGLERVIVIDDGSTDGTADIAAPFDVTVLRTSGNLGKTAALAFGMQHVTTDHVVLLDADLSGLTAADVSVLIAPLADGTARASISLRGNAPRTWRLIGLDYISGERALPMSLLAPQLKALETLPRFGFEVFLNRLIISQSIPLAIVRWPDVASPSKGTKQGFRQGFMSDAKMMRDIFQTVSLPEILRQIHGMRRLGKLR